MAQEMAARLKSLDSIDVEFAARDI
jgi:hypothetical protein